MKNLFIVFLLLVIITETINAQSNRQPIPITKSMSGDFKCASDHKCLEVLSEDAERAIKILDKQKVFFESLESSGLSGKALRTISVNTPRVIPMVFHIVHQCGREKIGVAQVQQAIDDLNADFNGRNIDALRDTLDPFYHLMDSMDIEFRLATLDPNGNATTGVHWLEHFSSINGSGLETSLKSYVNWPRNRYLNVWIVSSTGGSGFAQYPWVTDGSPERDGIVISHDYLGTTGTSEAWRHRRRKILTHEVGHWLGLKHTWGDHPSYLSPGDNGSCPIGDGIDDTPSTRGSSAIIYPNYSDLESRTEAVFNPEKPGELAFRYDNSLAEDGTTWGTFYDPNDSLNSPFSTVDTFPNGDEYNFPVTCDTIDNIYNFMDYGCAIMFTKGQVNAMYAILDTTMSQRNEIGISKNYNDTFRSNTQDTAAVIVNNYFFQESDDNDGSIKKEIHLTLTDGKWGPAWNSGTATITADSLPEGLNLTTRVSDDLDTLFVGLEGNAFEHTDENDVQDSFALTICVEQVLDSCVTADMPFWKSYTKDSVAVTTITGITIDFIDKGSMRHNIYRTRAKPDSILCLSDNVDAYQEFGLGIYRYLHIYSHKHLDNADTIRPEGFYFTKEGNPLIEVVSDTNGVFNSVALLDLNSMDLINVGGQYTYKPVSTGVEEGMLAIYNDYDASFPSGNKYIGLRFTFGCSENKYYGWMKLNFDEEDATKTICLVESYYNSNPYQEGDSFIVGVLDCELDVVDADSNYFISQVKLNADTLLVDSIDPSSSYSVEYDYLFQEGENVSMELISKYASSGMNWYIYFDQNQNGSFEYDEQIYYTYGTSPIERDFYIPVNILDDSNTEETFQMRIISSLNNYGAYFSRYILSPCGSIGETGGIVDVNVKVGPP